MVFKFDDFTFMTCGQTGLIERNRKRAGFLSGIALLEPRQELFQLILEQMDIERELFIALEPQRKQLAQNKRAARRRQYRVDAFGSHSESVPQ
jgi:hypothetical protein